MEGIAAILDRAGHDKLLTAALLARAGVPHPRTVLVRAGEAPPLAPPVVVKPAST